MTDNIAPLFGQPLPDQPDPEVIEKLRELLAAAEAGDISALAYVAARKGNRITRGWISNNGEGHRLSSGILRLAVAYAQGWEDDE
jgi:hypothetical protein